MRAKQYAKFACCLALFFSVKPANFRRFYKNLAICKPKSAGGRVTATT
nr:MAG TPA: hypothetical protein [Caudoviricetes sp.]